MKERIIEFLKSENKSSAQFAEEIGVQPSGISHILSGRNNPSLDFVMKMLDKYKFLSTEWLLFGKGKMYKEPEMQRLFEESLDFNTETPEIKAASEIEAGPQTNIDSRADVLHSERIPVVQKIVWFYNDMTFREYLPGHE
jgi:transcriptional regulator with XRE-family HTH domain